MKIKVLLNSNSSSTNTYVTQIIDTETDLGISDADWEKLSDKTKNSIMRSDVAWMPANTDNKGNVV